MVDLFRKLLLALCDFVYSGIPGLYKTFYVLASAELFSADDIQKFASNIYILISVIMLFAFGVKLIEAIVNPDLLADTKKGTAGVFKRAIIALGLIVFIPYGFNKIYDIQSKFLKSNFFEKLIIGNTSINNYSNTLCSEVSAGQIMAGTALHQFLYPVNYGNVVVTEETQSSAEEYTEIMVCDITKLGDFEDVINEKDGGKYTFHFDGLFALGTGIFLIYELVILCIDTALRLVKLGFLQLIAPIIVSAYIFTGTENLVKYLKEVGSTFAQVFARVAAFAFYILVLSKIESALAGIASEAGKWGTIFFLIGALQFVKLVPNLLGSLFGMNIQNKGGISGRLGEMAGVGGLAQTAWNTFKKHPLAPVTAAAGAALGTAAHLGATVTTSFQKGRKIAENVRKNGGKFAVARGLGGGLLSGAGGVLSTLGATARGASSGWKNRNLQGVGQEFDNYLKRHDPNTSSLGRRAASLRNYFGVESLQDQMIKNENKNIKNGKVTYTDPSGVTRILGNYTDLSGVSKNYSEEEYKSDLEAVNQRIAEVERNKKVIDTHISDIDNLVAKKSAIIEAATKENEKSNSTKTITSVKFETKLRGANREVLKDSSGKDIIIKNASDIDRLIASGSISASDLSTVLNQKEVLETMENGNFNLSQMNDYSESLQNVDTGGMSDLALKDLMEKRNAVQLITNDMKKAANKEYISEAIADPTKDYTITDAINEMNRLMDSNSGTYSSTVANNAGITNIKTFDDLIKISDQAEIDKSTQNTANQGNLTDLQNYNNIKSNMENAANQVTEHINEVKRSDKYVNAGKNMEAVNINQQKNTTNSNKE